MTKSEVIAEIMYELKMSGSASFEVDEVKSLTVDKVNGGYEIKGNIEIIRVSSAKEVRSAIAKLGNNILWM